MARARSQSNGNAKPDKLNEAMTSLVQAQAAAQAQFAQISAEVTEIRRQQLEFERRIVELLVAIEKRMGRIEFIMRTHTGLSEFTVRLEDFREAMADLPARIGESFCLTTLDATKLDQPTAQPPSTPARCSARAAESADCSPIAR
jgi:hypothetical protein